MLDFKVFITNLAKYNEGYLVGEWVDLPTYGELSEIVEEILGDDEEFFITDYENNIGYEVGEYENIYRLDEILEEIEELDRHDFNKMRAVLDSGNYENLWELLDELEDYQLLENIEDEFDLGMDYVESMGVDLPNIIECHIDYEGLGRAVSMGDNIGYFSDYGYIYRA